MGDDLKDEKRERVCVCVCVCERERERERERGEERSQGDDNIREHALTWVNKIFI